MSWISWDDVEWIYIHFFSPDLCVLIRRGLDSYLAQDSLTVSSPSASLAQRGFDNYNDDLASRDFDADLGPRSGTPSSYRRSATTTPVKSSRRPGTSAASRPQTSLSLASTRRDVDTVIQYRQRIERRRTAPAPDLPAFSYLERRRDIFKYLAGGMDVCECMGEYYYARIKCIGSMVGLLVCF